MSVLFTCVYICTLPMLGAYGGQKRAWDPWEVALWMVVKQTPLGCLVRLMLGFLQLCSKETVISATSLDKLQLTSHLSVGCMPMSALVGVFGSLSRDLWSPHSHVSAVTQAK